MCRCLMKYVLFIINLIFTLIGLGLIALGIAVATQLEKITEEIHINVDVLPYILIPLGIVVFFIAFSGCCGSITETQWLLITYAVCMALLAAFKIVLACLLFINLSSYTSQVKNAVNDAFKDPNPNTNTTFHVIETVLKCCGTYGPNSYVNDYNLTAPTCCENPTSTTICTKAEAYQTGCTTMAGYYFNSIGNAVAIALTCILVYELVAMAFSIYIIKTMKSADEYLY